ncbi:MAG TPA: alpha/beta hydrolase-fold protein [Clostridia bacterium]|nr:alpha/beta hydrolase-fold protein [Clostridia bacterium]
MFLISREKMISKSMIVISLILSVLLVSSGCSLTNDPRSAGFSEPLQESQIVDLSIKSEYMSNEVACLVYLPKGYGDGKEYPVWYGLNGFGSSENMWIDDGGIAKAADELADSGEIKPMIMVFPYTRDATMKEISKDMEDGKIDERNMDRFVCEELVPYIDSHYFTVASAKGRYIGGFSMGGMIALRIAFHHTDMFSKVGGNSAAVTSSDYSDKQLEKWLYPNDKVGEITDINKFDKEKGLNKLTIFLEAGNNNDPFSAGLQSLNDALKKRGIKSEFRLFEGSHNLNLNGLKDYLKFYAAQE